MPYTIKEFWNTRLNVSTQGRTEALPGWVHVTKGLDTFVEAPIELSDSYPDGDPNSSNILLVSAPGAVGKTTLARQIAYETGAVLVDLAKAEPVGANTLVGGLAVADLYAPFQSGTAGLIVDGLDEARMRVTQESMGAFMRDVVKLAADDRNPVVLLGRTGAVQDAWLLLSQEGVEVPVLEIGYYNEAQASEFAKKQIQHIRGEANRREPDGRAVDLMLERLRNATLKDGGSFSGYSPVLIAIAKRVASPREETSNNTQALISRIEKGEEVLTLEGIADAIMSRERGKLASVIFEDTSLRNKLYGADEQIARLIARLYGGNPEITPPSMSVADQERYSNALETWVQEHPFLDGEGRDPSSAVFGGLIAARALRNNSSETSALSKELAKGTAVNPFLAEFYISSIESGDGLPNIPAEHLGVLYASIRARLSLGEFASLIVDGYGTEEEKEETETNNVAEIEIIRDHKSLDKEPLLFRIDARGKILFGPHIEDVDISAPLASVTISYGTEAVLVAPIFIEADTLAMDTDRLVAEDAPHATSPTPDQVNSVQLLANEVDVTRITTRPIRRGVVSLQVTWPNSDSYPWTDFSVPWPRDYDERTEEAVRRLKKILRLFRSHGKNQLAKYRGAIDHRRRTKGVGSLVRDQLLTESVLTVNGAMYFLDPDRLAEATGLNFHDVRTATIRPETIDFVQRALNQR